MRHPSEFFIKFILTQDLPQARDNNWVVAVVTSFRFPAPESFYLDQLRANLAVNIPTPFRPRDRYHRESVKFLRDEGILGMHNPDPEVRRATELLLNLRVRHIVEQLLLGRIEAKEIARKINARFNEHHTTAEIEIYSHYYWNVGLLRVEEWAKVLDTYEDLKGRGLSILQVGPAMALHQAGFEQRIESKNVLREMLEAIYFDFRDWKGQPRSRDRTTAFARLAKAACVVDTQLSQAEAALRDSLKEFEKFRMQQMKEGTVDMHELAPTGAYSQSGARLLEAAPIDPEESED